MLTERGPQGVPRKDPVHTGLKLTTIIVVRTKGSDDDAVGSDDANRQAREGVPLTGATHRSGVRQDRRLDRVDDTGVRDSLVDEHGSLRIGVISYTLDLATGLAMGAAVLDRGMWTMTTDLDVHLTTPVRTGPLRAEVEVVRAGQTTTVSSFSLDDDGLGRSVGGGTATGRPFPFEFDGALLRTPLGEPLDHRRDQERTGGNLIKERGLHVGEDGTVEVDLEDWLRNPWGILHGGVTACMIDLASEVTGSAALGGPSSPSARWFATSRRVGSDRSWPPPPCSRSTRGGH